MAQGKRGLKGQRGETGAQGVRGPAGATGRAGPKMKAAEVLALVDDQFGLIRKQLDMQLMRTAELQMQLDKIQKNTTEACGTLELMHPIIKALVRQG
jgi:hypothetical protein